MKGFTLLEVMVALAIMSGVILTVLSSVNYNLSLATRDTEETTALLLARWKIDEIEFLGAKDSKQETEGTFAPDWPDYSWKASVETLPVSVFKRLKVTVTWGTQRRSLSLEDYLVQ